TIPTACPAYAISRFRRGEPRRARIGERMSRPGGRDEMISPRKVRTPQSTVVANGHPRRRAGRCHRKQTANGLWLTRGTGKGETVGEEPTSAYGDGGGSANPTGSKTKRASRCPR